MWGTLGKEQVCRGECSKEFFAPVRIETQFGIQLDM